MEIERDGRGKEGRTYAVATIHPPAAISWFNHDEFK